ncbi:unnamed protein product [Nezara viridula]|uniref:Uncharacterized protein n=1 Tax=Nezara viridula TaxID=85310 RepID=A0A9P0GZ11_NEZVI|nr:unnamed protein product [Nezara viridula]
MALMLKSLETPKLKGVVAINDPKWPNALLVDEHHLGYIINLLNSHKEAIDTQWGYEYVRNHSRAIIVKEEEGRTSNIQMMSYKDLLITENDNKNKAYSCCLECSLGFIDYSNQPDNNYNQVFVFQDNVTKFTILKPLQKKDRDEISHCLLEIFSLIGVPAKIYTSEKSLIKSVFNKDIGNFCQNFSTKIKQPKNGTFQEHVCSRIDENIKEWMKSTMSTKWSQGLYFVQFRNNCYFNEIINAAPFYALLKPSYTYSRRKYTRYLYQKRDRDETPRPSYIKHPACYGTACFGNREIEGTSHLLEKYCRQDMKESGCSSLKAQGGETNNDRVLGVVHVKVLDNEYQRNIRDDDHDRANSINLEYGRQMGTVNKSCSYNKDHEEGGCNNEVNTYKTKQRICGSLNNEFDQVKEYNQILENKPSHLNNISNCLNEELCKEVKHNTLMEQEPEFNVLKDDYFENIEPEKYYDSINPRKESLEDNKKRKYSIGNDRLNMPEKSAHVLRLSNDQNNYVATSKLKQNDKGFEVGKDLYKKRNVSNYEYKHPIENKNPLRNENSKTYLEPTGFNSNNGNAIENVGKKHLNLNENLTPQENSAKGNTVRFAHDCRGKQVCSTCKKKKRHKPGLNSLSKTSLAIGSTVRVRVPVAERLKGYPNYILATIIEEKDRMYKVATTRGILKEMFKRDQLIICNMSVLDTGGLTTTKASETGKPLKCKVKGP